MKGGFQIDRPDTLIFLHIPKNAGRTFESILARQYAAEDIYDIYGYGNAIPRAVEKLKSQSDEDKRKIKLIKGHYQFGLHRFLPQESSYITFLRDPVRRVASHYNYVARDTSHPLNKIIQKQNMTLADYVSSGVSLELNNGQTRMISGNEHQDKYGQCSSKLLAQAKRNIDNHFSAVGLVERFDESLALMSYIFGWKNVYYAKTNVSAKRPQISELDGETVQLIKKYNDLDIELYRFAVEKFNNIIASCDETYFQLLKNLKIANILYKPISFVKRARLYVKKGSIVKR